MTLTRTLQEISAQCIPGFSLVAAFSSLSWRPSSTRKPKGSRGGSGHTAAVVSFLAAKMNGYYAGEGLDVELIAMRAPRRIWRSSAATSSFPQFRWPGLRPRCAARR